MTEKQKRMGRLKARAFNAMRAMRAEGLSQKAIEGLQAEYDDAMRRHNNLADHDTEEDRPVVPPDNE